MTDTEPDFPYYDKHDGSATTNWTRADGAGTLGSTGGQNTCANTSAYSLFIPTNAILLTPADLELIITVASPAAGSPKTGPAMRWVTASSGSGYYIAETTAGNSSSWDLVSQVAGVATVIATMAPAGLSSSYGSAGIRIRWRAVGSRHEVKIWEASAAEPPWTFGDPNVFVTVDTTKTTGGVYGWRSVNASSTGVVDNFASALFDTLRVVANAPSATSVQGGATNSAATTLPGTSTTCALGCRKNEPLLIVIFSSKGTDPPDSPNNVTCDGDVNIDTANPVISTTYMNQGGDRTRVTVLSAKAASDVAGATVTVTWVATQTGSAISIMRCNRADYTDADASSAFIGGTTAVENTTNVTSVGAMASPLDLPTFSFANSGTWLAVAHGNANETTSPDATNGWGAVHSLGHNSPSVSTATNWTPQNDETPNPTWATGGKVVAAGGEIVMAAYASATTDPPARRRNPYAQLIPN